MIKSVTVAGFVLIGLVPATHAVAQSLPPEIVILQNGTAHLVGEVEKAITAAMKACDKCDPKARREVEGAQRMVASLRKSVSDLRENTNRKYTELFKVCTAKDVK